MQTTLRHVETAREGRPVKEVETTIIQLFNRGISPLPHNRLSQKSRLWLYSLVRNHREPMRPPVGPIQQKPAQFQSCCLISRERRDLIQSRRIGAVDSDCKGESACPETEELDELR
jgi:hypothetical protein